MPRKKTCKSFPQKSAQALLILLLSAGSALILPHQAHADDSLLAPQDTNSARPDEKDSHAKDKDSDHQAVVTPLGTAVDPKGMEDEYGPNWKNILANHEKKLSDFQAGQQKRLKAAKTVVASEEKNMDDLIKTYPFLKDDFQDVKDTQKTVTAYMNKTSDHSIDVNPHIQIAEDRDPKTGINILFVSKSGRLWCGGHGCPMDVYVDDGAGYKKTNEFIVAKDMLISRVDGVSLFFDGTKEDTGSSGAVLPIEWVLKNHVFVENRPPQD